MNGCKPPISGHYSSIVGDTAVMAWSDRRTSIFVFAPFCRRSWFVFCIKIQLIGVEYSSYCSPKSLIYHNCGNGWHNVNTFHHRIPWKVGLLSKNATNFNSTIGLQRFYGFRQQKIDIVVTTFTGSLLWNSRERSYAFFECKYIFSNILPTDLFQSWV